MNKIDLTACNQKLIQSIVLFDRLKTYYNGKQQVNCQLLNYGKVKSAQFFFVLFFVHYYLFEIKIITQNKFYPE